MYPRCTIKHMASKGEKNDSSRQNRNTQKAEGLVAGGAGREAGDFQTIRLKMGERSVT